MQQNMLGLLALMLSVPLCASFGFDGSEVNFACGEFVPYFSYGGDLVVSGSCQGIYIGNELWFQFDLAGLDQECEGMGHDRLAEAPANSCGIHVHAGTSCDEDALGHYYSTEEDPWGTTYYATNDGDASGTAEQQEYLYVGGDLTILDKTMIIHGADGGRIACLRWSRHPR